MSGHVNYDLTLYVQMFCVLGNDPHMQETVMLMLELMLDCSIIDSIPYGIGNSIGLCTSIRA